MPINRRDLLAAAITSSVLVTTPVRARIATPANEEELASLSAWQLGELFMARKLSPVEVTQSFLTRIDRLNPELNAFAQVDHERAMKAARQAEKAIALDKKVGPLEGVPISVKQMIATEGLKLEDGSVAPRDAIAVARLRNAGAIILGTTTLAGPSAMLGEATVGASNPLDHTRVAGASSSGSAASVAAGLCPISIGSDGGGSTRLPAAWCGLLGLHPTAGRVPADDNLLRAQSRTGWSGSYGPLTRDALDATLALSIIAKPYWGNIPGFKGAPPDYMAQSRQGVYGLKIGFSEDLGSARQYMGEEAAPVVAKASEAAWRLADFGMTVDGVELQLEDWYPLFTRISAELSAGPLYPILARGARAWGQLTGGEIEPQWQGDIQDALRARQKMSQTLRKLFKKIDVLACPTSPRIAPTREEFGSWLASDSYAAEYTCLTGHMNLLGFPAISLPAGQVAGMPVGLQLIAPPDKDGLLLRVARAYLDRYPAPLQPFQDNVRLRYGNAGRASSNL